MKIELNEKEARILRALLLISRPDALSKKDREKGRALRLKWIRDLDVKVNEAKESRLRSLWMPFTRWRGTN